MSLGEGLIDEMYSAAVARWPLVDVDRETFQKYCCRVVGVRRGVEVRAHGLDLYLCCACVAGDREAMAIVEREGGAAAARAIARVNHDPEFVRETLQELWNELLFGPAPKIARYGGSGSLCAWLRVVATRMAIDRCRVLRVDAMKHVELFEGLVVDGHDPEALVLKHRYAGAFQDALRRAITDLSTKERALLRLHVEEGCTIDDLGRAYGVHRATAARWLEGARRQLFASVRKAFALGSAGMTDTEFDSVARLLRSDLEWSGFGMPAPAQCSESSGCLN